MTYTDKFINFYKNIRSAFTGKLYEEIEEEDILKLYTMEQLFKEYYQIEVCEGKRITEGKCPMFNTCTCKTAMCKVYLPDESCYWYRYFKNLIEKDERKI